MTSVWHGRQRRGSNRGKDKSCSARDSINLWPRSGRITPNWRDTRDLTAPISAECAAGPGCLKLRVPACEMYFRLHYLASVPSILPDHNEIMPHPRSGEVSLRAPSAGLYINIAGRACSLVTLVSLGVLLAALISVKVALRRAVDRKSVV